MFVFCPLSFLHLTSKTGQHSSTAAIVCMYVCPCLSLIPANVWLPMCLIAAHVIVPMPDSWRSIKLWSYDWVEGCSEAPQSTCLCLIRSVSQDLKIWLQKIQKPLKRCFSSTRPHTIKTETAICACDTLTHKTFTHIHCDILLLLWWFMFLHAVVSAQFHFITLHHTALSQPPCNANIGKQLKTALSVWVVRLLFTFSCSVN